MQKSKTMLIVVFLFLSSFLVAQTLTVTPYGVSPREAERSATDIFTVGYNGLKNVGVGTQMYLLIKLNGGRLNDPQWTATQRPPGSVLANLFGATRQGIDTSSTILPFKPDRPGTYVVTVTDGSYSANITINAANYIGVYSVINNVNCQTCHPSYVTKWEGTGHAKTLENALDGLYGSYFNNSCVKCHSTGYDATAANDGFDDFTFEFPTVLTTGTYQQAVAQFPDAMKRANVQCEACHGPASGHFGSQSDFRIQVSYDAANCAMCHDGGLENSYPEQFDYSRHAIAVTTPSGPGRESCVRCHTAAGFAQFVKGVSTNDPYFISAYQPITCAACHDPHDATNSHQVRKIDVRLADGTNVTEGGLGKLCMNCHQSRRVANSSYTEAPSSNYGPHYATQADVLAGTNVITFGETLQSSNHIGAAENSCVDCHMGEGKKDASLNVQLVGKHTFAMSTPGGEDNMMSCAPCHGGSLGANFADVRYFIDGRGDHDGNGVVEGLQAEVHGLLDLIGSLLPNADPHADVRQGTWTTTQLQAAYNMRTIYYDGSFGIHNPAFTVGALQATYRALGGVVSVDGEQEIPVEFTLSQNFPNPFNPSTNIRFSLPKASNVKLTIYDVLGKEVTTLVNNELNAGTHTIAWNASNLASGIYLYKLEAGDFNKTNKMLLMK